MLRWFPCNLGQRTQQCEFVGIGFEPVFQDTNDVLELIRNQVSVVALTRYDVSNATSRFLNVSLVTRYDVNMGVHHGLPRCDSAVDSNVESIWIVSLLENVLYISHEIKAGRVNRT